MNNRIAYLDSARGFAIFLVVVGHCIASVTNPVNQVILSFHMPLFFVISGMLLNDKAVSKRDVKKWLRVKCKHLLVPQITLGLFECIFIMIHEFIKVHTFSLLPLSDVIHAVLRWWFLLVLLQVNFVSLFLKNFILRNNKRLVCWMTALLLIVLLQQLGLILQNHLPCFLNVLPFALMFYMVGYFGKSFFFKISPKLVLMIPCAIVICVVVSLINTPVLMYENNYGDFSMFLITSLLGSFAVIGIFVRYQSFFFAWLGRVSIIVYVLQFHINQYCRSIAHKLVEMFISEKNLVFHLTACLTFVMSFCVCVVLAYFISKSRLKIAFGCE